MNGKPVLWYFADPMCSWCWGFTSSFEKARDHFDDDFSFAFVMGGLRPYTKESVTDSFREDILQHWREVHQITGQAFTFENAMPDGFVYDTEPAARAVLTVGRIDSESAFPVFRRIQEAFYVDQKDVSDTEILASLAIETGIDKQQFLDSFNTEELREATQRHYFQTREFGVKGFPTIAIGTQQDHAVITNGYMHSDDLIPRIQLWLDEN
jgi:putative protein-disulfide isomerase